MAGPLVNFPGPGCIVEFMQGNQIVQAWVMEAHEAHLRLYMVNKRETNLSLHRLLPWSGPLHPPADRAEMQSRLEQHRSRREDLAIKVDLSALWELVQGEESRVETAWLAGLLWSDPDVDEIAALGHALLAKKNYFKFSPPYFEVYTADQVGLKLEKQAQEEKTRFLVMAGAEFFRKIYEARTNQRPLRPEDMPDPHTAELLRAVLLKRISDPEAHDQDNLWKQITKGLDGKNTAADGDPYLPLSLAVGWGVLPEHHNYLLDQAGYDTGEDWAGEHQGLCAEIRSKAAALLRETPLDADPAADGGVDAMPLFSIDPPSTRDWDDALAARRTQAGYAVSIAIACPSLFWPFGSDLDKKTLRRASSLYFPEGDLFMLPRDICDLFSLRARQHRPALLLEVELDEDMTIKGLVPSVQCLRVQDNLSLGSCETILAEKEGASGSVLPGLSMAYALALRLREKRLARGAIVTERHEPDILLHKEAEGGISVRVAPGADYERGHTLVSEFMILYNAALAEWGLAAGIPLVYRTQAGAVSKEHSGVWTRPHEISRALQGLPPAKLSVEPKAHAGVGAGLYSSFTSPLRRYLDLLNQAQIVHYLRHGRPRLDQTELAALLPLVVSRLESVGKIQRFRLRYWKLVYMQQEQRSKGGPYFWEGVITDESNNMVSVMLHPLELSLRGPRALFGGRVMPGAGVGVRVGKINPLRNEIQIMEVTEL